MLTDPDVHEEPDTSRPYWTDAEGTAAAERVCVRYVIKPPQPLWLDLAPADSVIGALAVSRAQGGTAHRVTPEQWARLMAIAGGWPQPDASQDNSASEWTAPEIEPTVSAYFAMLKAELAGQPYVKAAANRDVRAATGRSRGSVEFKFANISAVLRELGLPTSWATSLAATTRPRCAPQSSSYSPATQTPR